MDRKLGQHIGMIARRARLALDVTQEDVATQIGVSTEFYSRIERGYALPSISTMIHMAMALGLSTDSLLGLPSDHGSKERPPEVDSPELRRLVRRLRRASPEMLRVTEVLLRELERLGR